MTNDITKQCSRCLEHKRLDDFHNQKAGKHGKQPMCKMCKSNNQKAAHASDPKPFRERTIKWRMVNPEKRKASWKKQNLRRLYNLSVEQYKALIKSHNSQCDICSSNIKLCIDHDHSTGEIRGILCGSCNSGIGFLRDDYNIVVKAAGYLAGQLLGQ